MPTRKIGIGVGAADGTGDGLGSGNAAETGDGTGAGKGAGIPTIASCTAMAGTRRAVKKATSVKSTTPLSRARCNISSYLPTVKTTVAPGKQKFFMWRF